MIPVHPKTFLMVLGVMGIAYAVSAIMAKRSIIEQAKNDFGTLGLNNSQAGARVAAYTASLKNSADNLLQDQYISNNS